jgi:hypothetical protein
MRLNKTNAFNARRRSQTSSEPMSGVLKRAWHGDATLRWSSQAFPDGSNASLTVPSISLAAQAIFWSFQAFLWR